ncbi:dienelactone hydrolase family protein [Sphingomonas sp. PL-96]|uniref:dienelactone hydrolase family protein n=1 Tax=Sphingomonas sp. PL-96 TaxID=2887201 RepID=UPI001E3DEC91|nr:dienelactone hydrolase family protein [Sphingomonas sp. PL-96]MCC2975100.1 dienelactone hydrolase family protein [Sphingomonas sp. PL-96]
MNGSMIRMTMADGAEIGVYHAVPQGERRGGLVLVQEIFGITDHIRDLCDGFAADGYEVLAPALFDREAPGFEAAYGGEGLQRGIELSRDIHPIETSVADVQACVDALRPKGPVFAVGYCYGGSVVWLAAAQVEGLAAVSSYYGRLVPESGEVPKVPTIAHFGRHDHGIPIEGVEALAAAEPANATVYIYDAGHGFNSDRRDDYSPEAAKLARDRTLELFRVNGG